MSSGTSDHDIERELACGQRTSFVPVVLGLRPSDAPKWAAETFGYKVDNSNLIPYAINQVEKASKAASDLFTTWAPLAMGPGGVTAAQAVKSAAGLQAGTEAEAIKFLGDVLIFKVAEVKVAQPGLYPILKPREIRQWLHSQGVVAGPDSEVAFESFLKQSNVPWIRPDMAFIPCPPFTVIGFNATTDIFIAPATDRISTATSAQPGTPEPPKDANTIQSLLNEKDLKATGQTATVTPAADNITVHVENGATPPSPYTDTERDQLKKAIVARLIDSGYPDEKKMHVELPPTQAQLDKIKADFNANQTDAANRWQIDTLTAETNKKIDCKVTKTGTPAQADPAKAVTKESDPFFLKIGAGPRNLNVHQ